MNFIEITIITTHNGIEPVTGRLYTLGIDGVEIEDKEDFDEILAMNEPNWGSADENIMKNLSDETKVKAYVADNVSGNETLQLIKASMAQLKALDSKHEFGRLEIELSGTSEEDWANNWKQYYKPTRVGRHVVIVPEWEDCITAVNDTVVKIDPGAAFGTGTHETTRLCIEFIEEFVTKNTHMLDIGTGSGILAVTALTLGQKAPLASTSTSLPRRWLLKTHGSTALKKGFHPAAATSLRTSRAPITLSPQILSPTSLCFSHPTCRVILRRAGYL